MKLLLFGGATEGRVVALQAAAAGHRVTLCVATGYGAEMLPDHPDNVTILAGRMDMDAMESLMRLGDYTLVVDATHPYATEAGVNIRVAAHKAGLRCLRLARAAGEYVGGCTFADSVAEACGLARAGNILAATGSKEIAAYAAVTDWQNRVYARVLPTEASVRLCREAGLSDDHIIAAQGPFTVEQNEEVLRRYAIGTMITKDGGTAGGFGEKLTAAQNCGVRVVVVRRPRGDDGFSIEQILELLGTLQ